MESIEFDAVAGITVAILEAEAKARQATHKQGDVYLPANLPEGKGDAREQAAALIGTGTRYVSDAKTLKKEAPDLYADVRTGKTSSQAWQDLPERVSHRIFHI
jgi:hypothetical protein